MLSTSTRRPVSVVGNCMMQLHKSQVQQPQPVLGWHTPRAGSAVHGITLFNHSGSDGKAGFLVNHRQGHSYLQGSGWAPSCSSLARRHWLPLAASGRFSSQIQILSAKPVRLTVLCSSHHITLCILQGDCMVNRPVPRKVLKPLLTDSVTNTITLLAVRVQGQRVSSCTVHSM